MTTQGPEAVEPFIGEGGICPRCKRGSKCVREADRKLKDLVCWDCLQNEGVIEEFTEPPRLTMAEQLTACGVNWEGFGHASFETFRADTPEDKRALDVCEAWASGAMLRRPGLFLFSGTKTATSDEITTGNGKTHLAVACLRDYLARGQITPQRARFVNMPALLYRLRDTFQAQRESWPFLKQLIEVPVLVLDDLGAERMTPWTAEAVYLILDGRIGRRTVITSNYSLKRLKESGEGMFARITSRIAGECRVVKITGPDRRLRQ